MQDSTTPMQEVDPHETRRIRAAAALALSVMTMAPLPGTMLRADEVVVLVPAYFYPTWWSGSPWDQLNTAAGRIPIEAIMNPASGPGDAPNSDYQYAVEQLQSAGGKVIGYVATGYGSGDPDDILDQVRDYITWYDVNGIFLDEMGNQDGALDYGALYSAIKGIAADEGIGLHVVGNPGEPFLDAQAFSSSADTLVIFEGPYSNSDPNGASFQAFPNEGPYTGLTQWWLNLDSSQVANLVYAEPGEITLLLSVLKAVAYNAGYLFITDGQGSNPWGGLPAQWDDEVSLIEAINDIL